jgi:Protein of unknown function (DUF2612)
MSGPPYPHPSPAPGSNAIGSFAIGISPIGTISPFDPYSTIISQYANSPILTALITAFNAAIDQTANIDDFYDKIWNVKTAQGYGLDVWGRIVKVSRTLLIPGAVDYLGFNEANSWTGFNQGGFYSGGAINTNYVLPDDDYRRLILAKAASNITDGSIQDLNSILLNLFPNRGLCYVADNQDMSMTYTFNFVLTPIELAILVQSGVLPDPAGVVIKISQPS